MKYNRIPEVLFLSLWEYKNSNVEKERTIKRLIVDVQDLK